jgi:predicted tellurium resistance membrane protein TerC
VDFNDPRWFLLLVGLVLLINRHFVVKLTAVVFTVLGVLWASGWLGQVVHTLIDGVFTPLS